MRDPDLRRSVLFVPGADEQAQRRALDAAPDVLVQDLEDFTPEALRPDARRLSAELFDAARERGLMAAVRINRLEEGGRTDLEAVVRAAPDLVLLPKCAGAADVVELEAAIAVLEERHGLERGAIEIVPNVETAAGLVALDGILAASGRVRSALLAAEDLATDLQAERRADGEELVYARSRFLLHARAAGIEPIDAPYTWSDSEGCERESQRARRLGFRSKSLVLPDHVAVLHRVFTPSKAEIMHARRVITAFEQARAKGRDRVEVDGQWVEPPTWRNARHLLERAERLGVVTSA